MRGGLTDQDSGILFVPIFDPRQLNTLSKPKEILNL